MTSDPQPTPAEQDPATPASPAEPEAKAAPARSAAPEADAAPEASAAPGKPTEPETSATPEKAASSGESATSEGPAAPEEPAALAKSAPAVEPAASEGPATPEKPAAPGKSAPAEEPAAPADAAAPAGAARANAAARPKPVAAGTPAAKADRPDPADQTDPAYKDRVYRSHGAIAGGVLLLAIGTWLGVDALVRGEGRTPWIALAGLLFAVPLVIAYTLRPAVYANEDRLRIRNPFRTITLPWGAISGLRSGYSNEVFTQDGTKFQLWAIPVSLRGRKKAARRHAQQVAADDPVASRVRPGARGTAQPHARDSGDQSMDDLREIAERREGAESAQGEPVAHWAYEILAPSAAGAVLLAVLLAVG